MRHYRYDRFQADAVGQNGGRSARRGLSQARAELRYGDIPAAFGSRGYLRPDGTPCVQVTISFWADGPGVLKVKEVVLYDGPADVGSLTGQEQKDCFMPLPEEALHA